MKNYFQLCLIKFCANNTRRRTFLLSVIALVGILTTFSYVKEQKLHHMRTINDCFHNGYSSDIQLLTDILEPPVPHGAKNIFFLETSCSTSGDIKLNSRQLCAIESAAKNNPQWNIFVLFAANVGFNNKTTSDMLEAVVSGYDNVHFRRINLSSYAYQTPMEEWMHSGAMFESNYVNSHLSDVLRYLTLYKYGGTYLDLDVVVLKDLDSIGVNYSGAESDEDVAAGVMNFEPTGFGHQVAELCVQDLLKNYNGFDWGNNGPGVITRVLQSICVTTHAIKMTKDHCYGFHVYPPNVFYAVQWRQHKNFFNETLATDTLKILQDSVVAHVWNKHSIKIPLKVGSEAAYAQLADAHCPAVYANCGENF